MYNSALWKALSAVLLCVLLIQLFSIRSWTEFPERIFQNPPPSSTESTPAADNKVPETELEVETSPEPKVESWSYEWERDRNNHGLTKEQCDIAFPELYNEIDRAVEYWKDRKITPQSIDLVDGNDGGVRVLIHDQQLRIINTRGLFRKDFRHRIIAVLQQLLRALTAAESANEPIPDVEMTIIVDDKPVLDPAKSSPLWAFTRAYADPKHDDLWLTPDFHFWANPPENEGFRQMQERARKHDGPLNRKIPKLAWRGVSWTNPEIRKPLLNVTDGKKWADVVEMNWDVPQDILPMDAFCKYRYVVNTEGRSWSARMTHLLNCDSLLFVHDVEWIAHYYHLLDTDMNCVRVERDFADLEEKIQYFSNHTQEAQIIANTAKITFRERYTTPAATACYWRKLLRSWATVSFTPATKVVMKGKNKQKVERPRGVSFEEFIVHDNTQDYPYKVEQHP
ncbi:hypothetical protein M409DRAFT_58838 [Zasmidium cellare ATCC 36951]|uniref:Glycosyl transferase CAP10 domain-containing protein n=1 Tax=Zasmidium cellare ATCC 36951 TaxID=1080233 RepID=A0A6A6C787_ZASCE|nr:uncharacterized protein M409DRAFT_58838 [Zasmidium cellare ATCC 36951]KAF2161762.1 hypothetical protein M409DRAFT_58838 [Zasmidium cellare ATCC 36951]